MNTDTAAAALTSDPNFRFTIREIGRGDLRKRMTGSRFLAKRGEYVSRAGMRVDIVDVRTGEVQTWNLALTKRFWA